MLPILKIEGQMPTQKSFDQNVFSILRMSSTIKSEQISVW